MLRHIRGCYLKRATRRTGDPANAKPVNRRTGELANARPVNRRTGELANARPVNRRTGEPANETSGAEPHGIAHYALIPRSSSSPVLQFPSSPVLQFTGYS